MAILAEVLDRYGLAAMISGTDSPIAAMAASPFRLRQLFQVTSIDVESDMHGFWKVTANVSRVIEVQDDPQPLIIGKE